MNCVKTTLNSILIVAVTLLQMHAIAQQELVLINRKTFDTKGCEKGRKVSVQLLNEQWVSGKISFMDTILIIDGQRIYLEDIQCVRTKPPGGNVIGGAALTSGSAGVGFSTGGIIYNDPIYFMTAIPFYVAGVVLAIPALITMNIPKIYERKHWKYRIS